MLEGVGLIEKRNKNNILWKPLVMDPLMPSGPELEAQAELHESLQQQAAALQVGAPGGRSQ